MSTRVTIEGTKFHINGKPTYAGRVFEGKPVEGLLFNSRMIQALFDDECPETRDVWAYPDTGQWDPARNTREFCAALPEYRAHGLLAVTVGLQGGGAVFTPEVYNNFVNSAFTDKGGLKPAYADRLKQLLEAADAAGMVVIVNYFYWRQATRYLDEVLMEAAVRTTDWLLDTGHENILVDVANESHPMWKKNPLFLPENVHRVIGVVQSRRRDGRRLLTSTSSAGGPFLPEGKWLDMEDFCMPHGNGLTPAQLTEKLRKLKATPGFAARPRPIVVNEDSVFVENLDAAFAEGCSWGFYCQGYGSAYKDRSDWTTHGREQEYAALSGYQTVPVNWGINTDRKRAFFARVKEITGGGAC